MTDHKAEAEKWITGTDKSGVTDPVAINAAMARAQVHATLHLAQQQRIANLIAVATAEGNLLQTLEEGSLFAPVFAQIREGLGL